MIAWIYWLIQAISFYTDTKWNNNFRYLPRPKKHLKCSNLIYHLYQFLSAMVDEQVFQGRLIVKLPFPSIEWKFKNYLHEHLKCSNLTYHLYQFLPVMADEQVFQGRLIVKLPFPSTEWKFKNYLHGFYWTGQKVLLHCFA